MSAIMRRLREGSTWAAIAVILSLFGVPGPVVSVLGSVLQVAPDIWDALGTVGAVAAAGAAIVIPDAGADASNL